MTGSPTPPPKRVVLRYEDHWDELRTQMDADRAAGLSPSEVRDGLLRWVDDGSFVEVGTLVRRDASSYRGGDDLADQPATTVPADGLIAGWGRRDGRLIFVSADDVALGSPVRGGAAASKATRVRGHALEQLAPLVQILAAARLEPGAYIGTEFVRYGYGVDLDFERLSSERILKIGIVTGPLADQAAMEASWCHLTLLAGPDASIHGLVGGEALRRGFADLVVDDLDTALRVAGEALARLPANAFDGPPPAGPGSGEAGPESPGGILDEGWSYELTPLWCPAARTRLGSIGGVVVGLIECDDRCRLNAATVEKILRVVHFCRAFRVPLVIAHDGLERPADATAVDVDAWRRLCRMVRPSESTVLELASGARRLADDLGVRPLWTAGTGAGPSVDVLVAPAGFRDAVTVPLGVLRPSRIRPDQDPRVRRRTPRTLQGS